MSLTKGQGSMAGEEMKVREGEKKERVMLMVVHEGQRRLD